MNKRMVPPGERELICQHADLTEVEGIGLGYAHCTLKDIKCFNYLETSLCGNYAGERRRGLN